jgi:glycosyltransferase involved in cell wall biosynthesis
LDTLGGFELAADASEGGRTGAAPALMMDLRPCYEGYAGIPQEARLLFAMFSGFRLSRFAGLASGVHFTSRRQRKERLTPFERTLEQTKALISQDTKRAHWPMGTSLLLPGFVRNRLFKPYLLLSEMFRKEHLDLQIDPRIFEDYIWMKLFERTLSPKDRYIVQRAEYFATEMGHEYARSLSMLPRPFQRRLNTQGWDLFFAASVSPYRLAAGTSMMIRYYDALPLLSPHTVGEPWPHALSHARMLQRNMNAGASFYCDSEPVRQDLLSFFPQAEPRVHTIPVTISSEYFPDRKPEPEIRAILARRPNAETAAARPRLATRLPKLFMAVSTLEPRKNYLKLFRGFEIARSMTSEPIQLLIVANKGWRSDEERDELRVMVRQGSYHLSNVPVSELRALYSVAHCVVAPSRAEGFDYCGVEAMACGTPVIASNIPVHRWVYGNAAEYFDPYDEHDLACHIARFAEMPKESGHLAMLRDRGVRQARLYLPSAVSPQWEAAIDSETRRRVSVSPQASSDLARAHG